mgnify:CR=1 FL=1
MIKVSKKVEMGLLYAFTGTFAVCALLVMIRREIPTRSLFANVVEIIAFIMFALSILFLILFMVLKSPSTPIPDKKDSLELVSAMLVSFR